MIRGSGISWDLRKSMPYEIYEDIEFNSYVGRNGDCYDRYLVRLKELYESCNIILQLLNKLRDGHIFDYNNKLLMPVSSRSLMKFSMESLINHFKLFTEGINIPKNEIYSCVEGPKGEIGFYVVSNGKANPWRYHVRAPSFINLTALEKMCVGAKVADVVVVLGSVDIVLGEVDR